MTRDLLYPFAGSFSIHLIIFLILLFITGTGGKIINNKASVAEVSFVGHEDKKMAAIMKDIAKIQKQSADLILFDGKINSNAGENPIENTVTETGFIKPVSLITADHVKNITNKKTSHFSMPSLKNAGSSSELFIGNNKTTVEKETLAGHIDKGGFLKNQQSLGQARHFKSMPLPAVKDTLINTDSLQRNRTASGKSREGLSDTAAEGASSISQPGGNGKPAANAGKSFSGLVSQKEKVSGDPLTDTPFNRRDLDSSPVKEDKEISLPSSSANTDVGMRITGEIKNRKIIKSYIPPYPVWLAGEGVAPVVVLRFTVLPDGRVKNKVFVKLTSGFTKLDKLAIKELERWVFAPLRGNNSMKEETGEIAFKFSLQ